MIETAVLKSDQILGWSSWNLRKWFSRSILIQLLLTVKFCLKNLVTKDHSSNIGPIIGTLNGGGFKKPELFWCPILSTLKILRWEIGQPGKNLFVIFKTSKWKVLATTALGRFMKMRKLYAEMISFVQGHKN